MVASEAMVIAEMILKDSHPDNDLDAATHVKQARKHCFYKETEDDWLAELDEIEMLDAFEAVGLSTVQEAFSSLGHNSTRCSTSSSQWWTCRYDDRFFSIY